MMAPYLYTRRRFNRKIRQETEKITPLNSNQDPNRFQDPNMLSFSPVGVAIWDISGWKLDRLNTDDLPPSQ
jgi:hypothetical protein